MRTLRTALFVALCAWWALAGNAHAETAVRVLATEPSGTAVTLGRNENFYLRIGYSTDEPVRIWARPYFQGKEVSAGTNPSRLHSKSGEALGWFFFMQPGTQVDEIRISAGDGSQTGTSLVATYPVRIASGSQPAAPKSEPAWLVQLKAEDARLQREEYEKRMSTPPGSGEIMLFGGFMLAVLLLGLAGVAAPVWALRRWSGGWRLAAAVPVVLIGFVVLRLVFDTARDPTSHNLWPFEILQVGVLSLAVIVVLVAARKFAGAES